MVYLLNLITLFFYKTPQTKENTQILGLVSTLFEEIAYKNKKRVLQKTIYSLNKFFEKYEK